MMEPWKFTDAGGDHLEIRPAPDPAIAIIEVRYHGEQYGPTAHVPAHRLASVVAAMYEAAGQDVPDLPVIHAEADVKALTGVLRLVLSNTDRSIELPIRLIEGMARDLLAHGVTLPEVAK